jgi:polysaccharide biosynthesis protein PslG
MRHLSRRRAAAAGIALGVAAVAVAVVLLSSGGAPPKPTLTSTPTTVPSTSTPTTVPSPPPASTEQFGANTGRLFNDQRYPPALIDAQLAALHDTGATVARSDALWEASEPQPPSGGVHHFDWSFDDAIAAALAAHGMTWLPIIDYSAPWAQSIPGRDHSPPASPADYAAYAAAVAGRYGPGGSFWSTHPELSAHPVTLYEIWNEPDNPAFWSPKPSAAGYANLYLQARQAIDSAVSGVRVLVGGLTHPASFLPAVLAAAPQLRGQLDGVAIHPYGANPIAVLAGVRDTRRTLDSLGLASVPLYVTEFGWTTSPAGALDYLPERLRPTYIQQTVTALGHLDCGLAAVLLYTWMTPEQNPADAQDWFGIHSPSGQPTADTAALAQGIRAATSPAAAIRLCA